MNAGGEPVAVHDGLVGGVDTPRLLGSRCATCGSHHFPAHTTCPYCASEDVAPVHLSAQGTLWAWTSVGTAPPGYRGEVPFGFGVVELPEGIRVVTRLTEADPGRLAAGQPVALAVVPLHTGEDGRVVTTYAFTPVETDDGPAARP